MLTKKRSAIKARRSYDSADSMLAYRHSHCEYYDEHYEVEGCGVPPSHVPHFVALRFRSYKSEVRLAHELHAFEKKQ
jgi:hypothetical protein